MYTRYKTRFPEAYEEGRGNITLTLSAICCRKLQEMNNASAYVNDLIYEDAQKNEPVEKKLIVASIMKNSKELEKYGYKVRIFNAEEEQDAK